MSHKPLTMDQAREWAPAIFTRTEQVPGHKPLTMDQAREWAPAIFTRTEQVPGHPYNHVATEDLVLALQEKGYGISHAQQQRTAYALDGLYTRHMVRMRKLDDFNAPRNLQAVVPEIIILNSHNASSKLQLLLGLWRFVCLNGMMTGKTIGALEVRHSQQGIHDDAQKALDNMHRVMLPLMTQQVSAMQDTRLSPDQQHSFATLAGQLRWPDRTDMASQLLEVRRSADEGDSVWQVFNRVQDAVVKGGFISHPGKSARMVRPTNQLGNIVSINRAMWDMAVELA